MTQKIYKIKAGSAVSDGDMFKSVYDTNNNGIVDDSEELGSQLPSFYDQNAHVASLLLHLSSDERDALSASAAPSSTNAIATIADINSLAITSVGANSPILVSQLGQAVTVSHSIADGNKHVPITGTNSSGKILTAGATAGSFSWIALPATLTSWLSLIDTDPTTYTGQAGKGVRVNAVPDGLEFYDLVDTNYYLSSVSFNDVTGNLSFAMSGATTVADENLDGRWSLLGHSHSAYDYSALNLTNGVVFSNLTVADGIISNVVTRTLDFNSLGSATSPIIITGGNVISHSIADGNKHVTATGTSNDGKVLTAGATTGSFSWQTPAPSANTTYTISSITDASGATIRLVGSDVSVDDILLKSGTFVDVTYDTEAQMTFDLSATSPSATTYLRGDNAWVVPPNDNDDNYVDSMSFATGTGILTLNRTGILINLDQDLDGRYELIGTNDNYNVWSFSDGTASGAITSADTLEFIGGTGITTSTTDIIGTTKGITINHDDTSTLNGIYGSVLNGTKIDQITVDELGHITAITTGATGSVTSVGTNAPLSGTVTTSGNLSITQAGSISDGYLSAGDWNTFNDKSDTNTWRPVTAGGNSLGAAETLAFVGGTNVTISESAGAVTINSTTVTTTDESADIATFVTFTQSALGNQSLKTGTNLIFNASVGRLTATSFGGSGAGLNSIPNNALDNNTISGVALGGTLATLTAGTGLLSNTYNGSAAKTFSLDYVGTNSYIHGGVGSGDPILSTDYIAYYDNSNAKVNYGSTLSLPHILKVNGLSREGSDTFGADGFSTLTQAQFDAATKDADTLYFIINTSS